MKKKLFEMIAEEAAQKEQHQEDINFLKLKIKLTKKHATNADEPYKTYYANDIRNAEFLLKELEGM